MDERICEAEMCLLATEWWKLANRVMRLCYEFAPDRAVREQAMVQYARRRIASMLSEHDLRMIDHTGAAYSPSIPAEPVNGEEFNSADELVVIDMIEPTIMRGTRIVSRGRVAVGPRPQTG